MKLLIGMLSLLAVGLAMVVWSTVRADEPQFVVVFGIGAVLAFVASIVLYRRWGGHESN